MKIHFKLSHDMAIGLELSGTSGLSGGGTSVLSVTISISVLLYGCEQISHNSPLTYSYLFKQISQMRLGQLHGWISFVLINSVMGV